MDGEEAGGVCASASVRLGADHTLLAVLLATTVAAVVGLAQAYPPGGRLGGPYLDIWWIARADGRRAALLACRRVSPGVLVGRTRGRDDQTGPTAVALNASSRAVGQGVGVRQGSAYTARHFRLGLRGPVSSGFPTFITKIHRGARGPFRTVAPEHEVYKASILFESRSYEKPRFRRRISEVIHSLG